jgi:hypothetical protein
MGTDKFYMYDGRVQVLPCTIREYIFKDININQADQVVSGTNESYNEVWWYYCSADSSAINRYAVYNYLENIWYYGSLERTAWLDKASSGKPLAAEYNSNTGISFLYEHEIGVDADGAYGPVTKAAHDKQPTVSNAPATEATSDNTSEAHLARIQELAGVPQDSPSSSAVDAPPKVASMIGPYLKNKNIPSMTPIKAPPMPTGQLQSGEKLETNPDGTISYASGQGTYTYDKTGNPLKYTSPSFSGITQTNDLVSGNIAVRYAVGPLDVTVNFDKNGKSLDSEKVQYDLGLGVMGHERNKGITATTWQDRGNNVIQSRDMVKDPAAYDRAMSQVKNSQATNESKFEEELTAMLRIAKLK